LRSAILIILKLKSLLNKLLPPLPLVLLLQNVLDRWRLRSEILITLKRKLLPNKLLPPPPVLRPVLLLQSALAITKIMHHMDCCSLCMYDYEWYL
jgi:hypothetical protein